METQRFFPAPLNSRKRCLHLPNPEEEVSCGVTLSLAPPRSPKNSRTTSTETDGSLPRTKSCVFPDLSQVEFGKKAEQVEEDRRMGISTELTLYQDPWKIRKTITGSDLGGGGGGPRLLLTSDLIQNHILPSMPASVVSEAKMPNGAAVVAFDVDTWTEHALVFKQWPAMEYYMFMSEYFLWGRDLKEGDVIGLYWDRYYSRLHFAILRRGN
ncbi:hypothetical protein Tsubulata_028493 [Turnera subulata]|uniref:TF-B3 domain-containing protein n=1 Tax=Turnera subulata TaxID=218843 RepID=A0A9Q0FTV3_9ROSI|nr:hypothetical protein Tsubulata_028493 [Turnera subulata]